MASPFEFAAGTPNTVELDSNRKGTVSFTVTNVANRRINAITSIRAPEPQAREWITVQPSENDTDSGYRGFGVESTQTFDVVIDAASADPGSYTFRLVVADEFDPDENFTESPQIQFTVPDTEQPDEDTSQPPWPLIIGGVVLVIAVIGVIAFFLLSGDDTPRVEIIQETTLRESPSTVAAEVTIVSEEAGSLEVIQLLEDETWAEVRTEDGETGWVPVETTGGLQGDTTAVARLSPTETPMPTDTPAPTDTPTPTLTPTPTATSDPTCRATVTTNELNFRAGPNVDYDDIGTFRTGESFEVIGRQGNWAQIITPGGEGWIALQGSGGTFAELSGSTCSEIPTVSAPALAQFDAPSQAREGDLVSFQNQSLGDIDALQWFFGAPGLGSSNDPNPSVTYDTPGTYTVTLQVRGTDGITDETTRQIRILATPTRVPTTPPTAAGTINISDYSSGRFIASNFFASEGIASVRAEPDSSYCSDASRATLSNWRGETVLSTGSSSITTCNAVPISIEFTRPVRSVELTFLGAQVDYRMNVFNTSDGRIATRVQEGSLSSERTISYTSGSPNIKRITFGRSTAITAILEIQFDD